MGEERKALRGQELWGALKGVKDTIEEKVPVKFGEVNGEVTVKFVDVDVIQDIIEEYEEKKPKKPNIAIKVANGTKNISVPTTEEKYKAFNTRPDAKEKIKKWEKECEPIEREKRLRLAYEFMIEVERPEGTLEEALEILDDRLRFMDIVNIVNKGTELNSLSEQLDEAKNDF
ncbi:MAG: hypothetical protein ACOCRK_01290 [bacterium]